MTHTRPPPIDAARWVRLKDHVADLTEMDPGERPAALDALALDAADRDWLRKLVAPLLAGDARLSKPHAPALDRIDDEQLRWRAGDTIGRYLIIGLLGRGGMGEVYEARERDGESRLVALKVLRAGLAQSDYARFSDNEQRALRRLDDPRIAKFIEAFATPEVGACLVLELVDGEPLQTYCRSRRFGLDARLRLFVDVCQAVASAHRQLVVHRDLKPSNVLVTPDGHVKLLDFGVSKLLDEDSSHTQTYGNLFTLDYAAPEQVLHEAVSTATDVYALGVLLFRLLTDASPYERQDHGSLVKAVLDDPPQSLAAGVSRARAGGHNPPADRVDRDLDHVIARAMEKQPQHRYGSALELAADVQAVLDGRPISAGGGAFYRVRKLARRHRAAFAAALAGTVILLAATAFSLHAAHLAERQAHRAEVANGFLLTALDLTDRFSSNNRGDFTLAEVLERAVTQARTELRDEPEVRANVLTQLSRALQNRGKHKAALDAARDAYAIRQSLDASAVQLASAAQQLASLEIEGGLLDDADTHLQETLVQIERGGSAPVARVRAYSSLGKLASIRGDAVASLRWYQKAVPERESLPGDQATDLAMDYSNVATGLYNLSRFREADASYVKAIDLLRAKLGENHPRIGFVQYARITALIQLGRFDESRALLEQTEAILNPGNSGGTSAPSAVNTDRTRAQLEYFAGDYARAHEHLESALAQTRNASPISVAPTLTWRGRIELAAGDYRAAAATFAEADQLFAANGRSAHAQRWYARGLHGVAIAANGDRMAGNAELDDALAQLTTNDARTSTERTELSLHAGAAARGRGDVRTALALHREAEAMQREIGWLGELGAARVDAELALDGFADGADPAAREEAAARAARSIEILQRINPHDPALASLGPLPR